MDLDHSLKFELRFLCIDLGNKILTMVNKLIILLCMISIYLYKEKLQQLIIMKMPDILTLAKEPESGKLIYSIYLLTSRNKKIFFCNSFFDKIEKN